MLGAEPPSLASLEAARWPGILSAAVTGTEHERWRAIEILGELRDRRAVPALLSALADRRGTVRPCLAARSLGRLRDARAMAGLIDASRDASNQDLRLCAIQALGLLRDARAVPALVEAIERRDMVVAAAFALARIADPRGASAVEQAALDPALRPWLAQPLGEFGLARVEPLLRELADDGQLRGAVRREAKEGLWKNGILTQPLRSAALAEALASEADADRRAWAAFRLGDEALFDGRPALAAALGDGKEQVRMAAAVALVRLGPAAERTLLARLEDAGPAGALALAALGFVGGQHSLTALEERPARDPAQQALQRTTLRWLQLRGIRAPERRAEPSASGEPGG